MTRRLTALLLAVLLLAGMLFSCGGNGDLEPVPETETQPAASEAAEDPEPRGSARFTEGNELLMSRSERTRHAPDDLGLTLTFNGTPLPHAGKTWYFPVTAEFQASALVSLGATVETAAEDGSTSTVPAADILLDDHLRDTGITPFLAHNNPTEVIVLTDDAYAACDLIFTTLPVVSLDPAKRHLTRNDCPADFALWEPRAAGPHLITSASKVKVRGASSSSLAKVPYKVSLLDENGEPKNISLCGMRKDDDWILYATHSDNTHVRDMVGWRLWKRMTETSDALTAAPLGAEYVELLIGGKYEGLYVLMERVDAKTLSLDAARGDTLFKCISWDVPAADGLARQGVRSLTYSSMEKKFPDPEDGMDGSWDAIAEYVRLCYESPGDEFAQKIADVADVNNMLEYWLFVNIAMAADNTWKNTYYANVDGKMTAYPWDLDITFGLGWNGELANNYLWEQPDMDKRTYDFQCGRRLIKYVPGAADYVKERWTYLTLHSIADAETLIADAHEFWDLLHTSGAWDRNLARWPNTNSTDSLDYFEKTVRMHTKWFGNYLKSLP
ncbi:MAG: CotH kinase family protein [Clostridia bacterium]|nr:CotH kinase family protein [Clostridia bacterium]